ncbi:ImmA/IrrE family metallo-endopeptidase [Bacillus carboniphilus]|uniref:ImmA/IrrE family metallo-endopeptidase n=1 Tax=Bacillus carboniphilus TaxID=86663 RepID=A0ABN0VNX6_9BACI
MKYQTIFLEDWIKDLYDKLDIKNPNQLNIKNISENIGIRLTYRNVTSRFYKNEIIIDNRQSLQEQWQEFGHELCHALRHEGNQLILPNSFLILQECQANTFMYHFCVPTFMLLEFKLNSLSNVKDGVPLISKTFNVTEKFAEERLKQFKRKMLQAKSDAEHRAYMEAKYPKVNSDNYSEETKAILNKLYKQLEKKKEAAI